MPAFQGLAGHAGLKSRSLIVLPGLLVRGVEAELSVDAVGDLALQRAHGFARFVAVGDLAVVVGAAFAVGVADLGDGDHVDRVVQRSVAASRQPVHGATG